MRTEAEIREAIHLLLRTLDECGLEARSRGQLKAAVEALRYVLRLPPRFFSVERSLAECRELLEPVEG